MHQIKPSVVDEEMEGELLAIDDTTGKYFAVRGTGLWLWQVLRFGVDLTELEASLEPAVAVDVNEFVARLTAAGLLIESTVAPLADAPLTTDLLTVDPLTIDLPITEQLITDLEVPDPWSSPEFEVHDDLQDLLLLDPIHEVTDDGWPNMGTAG